MTIYTKLFTPSGRNVYRLLQSLGFLAPTERNVWFGVFIYQYIALCWSAKLVSLDAINI
jgi:hypothetical protein